MKLLFAFVVTLLAIAGPAAHAGPFDTMSYQGVLTDPNGVIVPDANYSLRFRLYRPDGTTVVWEETQNVAVAGGRFNVALGAVVSLASLAFDETYLLGTKVGADPEMLPLTPLRAAPYSQSARTLAMEPATRFYSVCAESFTPNSQLLTYTRNTIRIFSTSAGFASYGTSLHLPHGARLTEFKVLFEDYDATLEVAAGIRRTHVTDGTFGNVALLTSGVTNAAGPTPASTTNFFFDTIDNENYAYSIQLSWNNGAGINLTFVAARITYEISEPLP